MFSMIAARRWIAPIKPVVPPPTIPIFSFLFFILYMYYWLIFCEKCIKRMSGRLKIDPPGEGARLACPMFAIHCAVLPLNGKRSLVSDGVECADDLLKVDLTSAHAPEIPVTAGITERNMSAENADLFGDVTPVDILHMYMEDPFGEPVDKIHVVHPLVTQVAGIVVEAEGRVMVQRFQCSLCREGVEGDLSGMHLQRKADAQFFKLVQDGHEPAGKKFIALFNHLSGNGREGIEQVPYRAAGESHHRINTQRFGCLGRQYQLLSSPPAYTLRVTIAPDMGRQDGLVPFIYTVADRLSHQVRGDGAKLQSMFPEQLIDPIVIRRVRLPHIQVVRESQFQSVISEYLRFEAYLLQR